MSVFQDLYDSEINFTIETFWDAGFTVKLGDDQNGFLAEKTFQRFGEIEPWLTQVAIQQFPDSKFAKLYRDHKGAYLVIDEPREPPLRLIHPRDD